MTKISMHSAASGEWMSDFCNSDYAKNQFRKVEADYMSRLRQHVEEQKNKGTYVSVANAIDDFSTRLGLTSFEKTALSGLARYAQLGTLPDLYSEENLEKEVKEQGAPTSILPGVKPSKETNKQKINTDIAEDSTGKGPEGSRVQQAKNKGHTVEAVLEDSTYLIKINALGLYCDLKVQKIGSNQAVWELSKAPGAPVESFKGSVEQIKELAGGFYGAINEKVRSDKRAIDFNEKTTILEKEIKTLGSRSDLEESEKQEKLEELLAQKKALVEQLPKELVQLKIARQDIRKFRDWIDGAEALEEPTLALPTDLSQKKIIRRVIPDKKETPFQEEKKKRDEEKGRSLDKYLEGIPDLDSTAPSAPLSKETSSEKKNLLPKILLEAMDKGKIKDKTILGISGIKAADYRDGYKEAKKSYDELVAKKEKATILLKRIGESKSTIEIFLTLKRKGKTFTQAIQAKQEEIDNETAKENPNDEILVRFQKDLTLLERHRQNFKKVLESLQLSEFDSALEMKLKQVCEKYDESDKRINDKNEELVKDLKESEFEMQICQSELDKNALLEHLQEHVSIGLPDQKSEEFQSYFKRLTENNSKERIRFETSLKKTFDLNNKNQAKLVERLLSFVQEGSERNVSENASIYRALSKHSGFLTIKPEQLQGIYQKQLEAREPVVERRKNQVRKNGQEYVRSIADSNKLYKGFLPVNDLLEAMPVLIFGKSKKALQQEQRGAILEELNGKRVAVLSALIKAEKGDLVSQLTAANTTLSSTTDNAEKNLKKRDFLISEIEKSLPPELRGYAGEVGRTSQEAPDAEAVDAYFNNVVLPEMIKEKVGADSNEKTLAILQKQALIQGYATEAYDVSLADSINQIYIDHCSRFTGTLTRKRSAHQNIINHKLQASKQVGAEALKHLSGAFSEEGISVAKLYLSKFYQLFLEISEKNALRPRGANTLGENPLQPFLDKLPEQQKVQFSNLTIFPWTKRKELALALIVQEMATPLSKKDAQGRLESLYPSKEEAWKKLERIFSTGESGLKPIHTVSEIEQGSKALAAAVLIKPSLKTDSSRKALEELSKKQKDISESLVENQEALSSITALGEATSLVFMDIAGGQNFRVITPATVSECELSPRNLRERIAEELNESGYKANEFQMNALLRNVLVAFNKKRYGEYGESLVDQKMEGEPTSEQRVTFEQALYQQLPTSIEEKEALKGTRAVILEAASAIAAEIGSTGVVTGGRSPIFIFETMPTGEGTWIDESSQIPFNYSIDRGSFQGHQSKQVVQVASLNVIDTPFDIWVGDREKIEEQVKRLYESKKQYIARYPDEEISEDLFNQEKKASKLVRRERFFKAQLANEEVNALLAKKLSKKDEESLSFSLKACELSPEEARAIWTDLVVDQVSNPKNPLGLETKPGPKRSRWGKQGGNFMAEGNMWKVGKKASIYEATREWLDQKMGTTSVKEDSEKEKKAREISSRVNGLHRLIGEVSLYSPETRISLPPIEAFINPKFYGKDNTQIKKIKKLYEIMKGKASSSTINSEQAANYLIKFSRNLQKDLMSERLTVLNNGRCNTNLELTCPNQHKDRDFTATVSYLIKESQMGYLQETSKEDIEEILQWSENCVKDFGIDEDSENHVEKFKRNRYVIFGKKPTCPVCGYEFENLDSELNLKREEKQQKGEKSGDVKYLEDLTREAAKQNYEWIQEKLLWLDSPDSKSVKRKDSPIDYEELEKLEIAQADATKREKTRKDPKTKKVEVVGYGVRLPLIKEILMGADSTFDEPITSLKKDPQKSSSEKDQTKPGQESLNRLNWQVELVEQLKGWKKDLMKAFGFKSEIDPALLADKRYEIPGSLKYKTWQDKLEETPKKLVERAPIYKQTTRGLSVGYDQGSVVLYQPETDAQMSFFTEEDATNPIERKPKGYQLRKSAEKSVQEIGTFINNLHSLLVKEDVEGIKALVQEKDESSLQRFVEKMVPNSLSSVFANEKQLALRSLKAILTDEDSAASCKSLNNLLETLYGEYIGISPEEWVANTKGRFSEILRHRLKTFNTEEYARRDIDQYSKALETVLRTPADKKTPNSLSELVDLFGVEAGGSATYTNLSKAIALETQREMQRAWGWLVGTVVRFKKSSGNQKKAFVFEQGEEDSDEALISVGNFEEVKAKFQKNEFPTFEKASKIFPSIKSENDLRKINVLRTLIEVMLRGKNGKETRVSGYLSEAPTRGVHNEKPRLKGSLEKLIFDFSEEIARGLPEQDLSIENARTYLLEYAWSNPNSLLTGEAMRSTVEGLFGSHVFKNEANNKALTNFIEKYTIKYEAIEELREIQAYLVARLSAVLTPKTELEKLEKIASGKPSNRFFYKIVSIKAKELSKSQATPAKIVLTGPLTPDFQGYTDKKEGRTLHEYNQNEIERALRTVIPSVKIDLMAPDAEGEIQQYLNIGKQMAEKFFTKRVERIKYSPSTLLLELIPVTEVGDRYDVSNFPDEKGCSIEVETDIKYPTIPEEVLAPMKYALPLAFLREAAPCYADDLQDLYEKWISQYFVFAAPDRALRQSQSKQASTKKVSIQQRLLKVSQLVSQLMIKNRG
jgi:uncharacterized protein (UPF0333 family)